MTSPPIIGIRSPGALDLIEGLLRQGMRVRIQVTGLSMRPFLQGGEIVEVAPLGRSGPHLGDLLLHRGRQGRPLVHRLIRRRYIHRVLHLQTQGDACAGPDPFVPIDAVLGRIQRIYVPGGVTGGVSTKDLRAPFSRMGGYLIAGRALMLLYARRMHRKLQRSARSP